MQSQPSASPMPQPTSCVSQGRVASTTQQCCTGLTKTKTASSPDVYMCIKPTTAACLSIVR